MAERSAVERPARWLARADLQRLLDALREPLLQIEMDASGGPGRGFRAETVLPDAERLAILGVRACDLAGLAVQDRVFLRDRFPDPAYAARRERLFLVAVGCTRSVETCFCASMDTGPEPRARPRRWMVPGAAPVIAVAREAGMASLVSLPRVSAVT